MISTTNTKDRNIIGDSRIQHNLPMKNIYKKKNNQSISQYTHQKCIYGTIYSL